MNHLITQLQKEAHKTFYKSGCAVVINSHSGKTTNQVLDEIVSHVAQTVAKEAEQRGRDMAVSFIRNHFDTTVFTDNLEKEGMEVITSTLVLEAARSLPESTT